ncbi:MAG: hypothetical protein WEC79_05350, partial [Thermomicrobiales bacterium]
ASAFSKFVEVARGAL